MEFKNNKVVNLTSRKEPSNSSFVLKDLALKYYDDLEAIVNDLASKCTGGEECKLSFDSGIVIIKLK